MSIDDSIPARNEKKQEEKTEFNNPAPLFRKNLQNSFIMTARGSDSL